MKSRKKTRFKKVYWLSACLVAASAIFVLLLLYKPPRYNPSDIAPAGSKRGQVSKYLTHVLSPQLYNGAQLGEPFELIIIQKGINEIIAQSKWPKQSGGVMFSAPEVLFVADSIVLMGTAAVGGAELIVTVIVEPRLEQDGLLNLRVTKVKIGAMNITPFAKVIAKRMYSERLAAIDIDTGDLQAQVVASLLDDEPFEPVFKIDDKKVRVKKITVEPEKLTVRLTPVSD